MDHGSWSVTIMAVVTELPAVVLNLYVVLPNIACLHRLSPSSFLVVFLCLADALSMMNQLVINATHLINGHLEYNKELCQAHAFMATLASLVSVSLCTGLTLLRYRSIVMKREIAWHFAPVYAASAFALFSLILSLPFMLGTADTTYGMHPSNMVCTIFWFKSYHRDTLILSLICAAVLSVPLFLTAYAYLAIYMEVSRVFEEAKDLQTHFESWNDLPDPSQDSNRNESAVLNVPPIEKPLCAAGVTSAIQELQRRQTRDDIKKQMNLLYQSIAIVALMVGGWAPYFAVGVMEVLTATPAPVAVEVAADMFIVANSILNPIVVLVYDLDVRGNTGRCFYWLLGRVGKK